MIISIRRRQSWDSFAAIKDSTLLMCSHLTLVFARLLSFMSRRSVLSYSVNCLLGWKGGLDFSRPRSL